MQSCKIEQNEQSPGAMQVMPTAVLGNGQQIILQSLQQQLNANGQQQIQVVPIMQGAQGTSYIVQPQTSQPQIVQLPDGQTFIYHQPLLSEQQSQPQIVNINGNYFQIPAQQTMTSAQLQNQAAAATSPTQQTQQVVMIPSTQTEQQLQHNASTVNTFNTSNATSPPPQPSTSSTPPIESEEEPLYVNASEINFKSSLFSITYFSFPFRAIQKNSYPTNGSSKAGSSRKDPKAAPQIPLWEQTSTRDEQNKRRRWKIRG